MNNRTDSVGERVPEAGDTFTRSWLHRLSEPVVFSVIIALIVLGVVWGMTLNLVASEQDAAVRSARALAADVAETYEAQAVRALREIDNTLKLVRYELDSKAASTALDDLRDRELLPPELLFTVTIAASDGTVLATTHPSGTKNISSFDYFRAARNREGGGLVVGVPRRDPESGEWQLYFSRRVRNHGGFAGVVVLSVHAGYFTSVYELDVMGVNGVLGLLGTDGVFRVRRTGGLVSAGGTVEYKKVISGEEGMTLTDNSWDGVRRYTVARKLFDFPLAIVVGLSEKEQLAPIERLERTYKRRAGIASALFLAVVGWLGRLSWQLQQARTRAMRERVAHAQRVEYLAYHDTLTDLPNRAFFGRLLTQSIQHARRYDRGTALLFLDLDRFKSINDSLGHEAGDDLLQEVARRLRGSVRESDIVARLGGDEFVVLLPETTEIGQVTPVADKILGAVGKPFTLLGQEFRITVSIGVAMFPRDGEDEETLMKNADIAMYHAKEQGKNNYQFFSEDLNADSLERLALESSLRNALDRGEFRLYYQAKRDMVSGRISGMEALLRWEHPDLGLVAPLQFIPLAEETGLIVPIGRWVLKTACSQSVAWQKEGFPALSMAVNLSARQFLDDHLLDDVKNVLRETGMKPGLLELEITESMIMHDMERTIRTLKNLKDMGIRVAIDDFGTGYSSLSALKQFPLDTIKIDGSFIHDVARSEEDKGLTEAVIAVGRSLGLTVVAEGVETAEQADFLRTHSCNEFQGFYINKPMPTEEFARLIKSQLVEAS